MDIPFKFEQDNVTATIELIESKNESKTQRFQCAVSIHNYTAASVQTDKISAFAWIYKQFDESGCRRVGMCPYIATLDQVTKANNALMNGPYERECAEKVSYLIRAVDGYQFVITCFGTHIITAADLIIGFKAMQTLIFQQFAAAEKACLAISDLLTKLYRLE